MALTLDGSTVLPSFGMNNGMGSGAGIAGGLGAGAIGGGLLGLAAGALLGGGLNRNGGGWGGNNGYGAAPAATAVATDIVLNPAFQSLQNQVEQLGGQISEHNLLNSIEDIQENLSGVTRDILGGQANIATALAAGNFTTLNSINGLGRDIVASNTQALINSIQNFNQVQLTQLTATNQIIAQGTANAAAMQECCCDIKGLILSDGGLTRALINANTMQDLRDRNVVLAGEVSNFRQNQFLIDRITGTSTGVIV